MTAVRSSTCQHGLLGLRLTHAHERRSVVVPICSLYRTRNAWNWSREQKVLRTVPRGTPCGSGLLIGQRLTPSQR